MIDDSRGGMFDSYNDDIRHIQVEACTRALQDGEEIMIGQGIKVDCLHTPG